MSWDADYQEYSQLKTPEAGKIWCSVKAGTSSDDLCSGLPTAYCSFLESVLSLAPNTVPDYDSYIKMFSCVFK